MQGMCGAQPVPRHSGVGADATGTAAYCPSCYDRALHNESARTDAPAHEAAAGSAASAASAPGIAPPGWTPADSTASAPALAHGMACPSCNAIPDALVVGIADGHGGDEVAKHVSTHLPSLVIRLTRDKAALADICAGITSAFEACDAMWMKTVPRSGKNLDADAQRRQKSGACVLCVLIKRIGSRWYSFTANAGDSRAILARVDTATAAARTRAATRDAPGTHAAAASLSPSIPAAYMLAACKRLLLHMQPGSMGVEDAKQLPATLAALAAHALSTLPSDATCDKELLTAIADWRDVPLDAYHAGIARAARRGPHPAGAAEDDEQEGVIVAGGKHSGSKCGVLLPVPHAAAHEYAARGKRIASFLLPAPRLSDSATSHTELTDGSALLQLARTVRALWVQRWQQLHEGAGLRALPLSTDLKATVLSEVMAVGARCRAAADAAPIRYFAHLGYPESAAARAVWRDRKCWEGALAIVLRLLTSQPPTMGGSGHGESGALSPADVILASLPPVVHSVVRARVQALLEFFVRGDGSQVPEVYRNPRVAGSLAVTRAMGDAYLKDSA
ncbi:MAG: hypothetical protein EOO41_02885, partial [Methanobacteriota archaeon]